VASSSRKNKGRGNSTLIQSVVKDLNNEFVGTFMGEDSFEVVEEWIPSTSEALNYALGDPRFGAFPQGRITELFGPKSSAKSLILYDAGAQVQKMGGIFVLIDTESSFSKPFGKYLGIDYSKFIYAHIRTIEEVTDFIIDVTDKIRAKDDSCPVLIGWDSLAAATSMKEDEEFDEGGKSEMGTRAKLMSRQMRKVAGRIYRENLTYIVVNQIRKRIGVMFGSPDTTPGGQALPFHASLRVKVTKTKQIKKSGRIIGHKVQVFVEKNKVRPPFSKTDINVYVDRVAPRYGLDRFSGLLEMLESDEVVTIKGKGAGKRIVLNSDTSIEFTPGKLGKHWDEYILPNIPEDLYLAVRSE